MTAEKPTIEDGAACAIYTEASIDIDELRSRLSMWFTDSPGPLSTAKKICREDCPVQMKCLEYAIENPKEATHGTWGGESQYMLKKLRNKRK